MSTLETALDLLHEVITQACSTSDGSIDSMCISTYAEAIRFLAAHGRLHIVWEGGRRVIAREREAPK